MVASGNGAPDDVVFQDEGNFYDPDDSGDESPAQSPAEPSSGSAASAVGASGQNDQQPRRRRRRRRRSRQGGEFQGGPPPVQNQPPQRHRHPRRSPQPQGDRQNGQVYDEREGAGGGASMGVIEGVLELHPKGYGFLRDPKNNYAAGKNDPFVAASLIEKHRLREGLMLKGEVVQGNKGQGPRFKAIESVEGRTLEEYALVRPFDELTAVNPYERIRLETGPTPITMRVLDLLTPLGKGQRALIVAPPRTGKTMLQQEIANSVSTNHPEMHLMVLLIDERPEEVTEMRRHVKGEVIASSMDRDVESHVRISQLIIERGKRIAEAGGQVFILLDSITRTARAFNKWVGNTGRTMSGGLDVKALDIPKKMFGTARRFDEGGSLTVVATALIDTGSRMDEVIFQEFKGTGNMELVLNRQLADRRIWPAIDIGLSGTRREELILPPDELEGIIMLRRSLVSLSPNEAMEQLVKTLQKFPSNREFLARIKSIL
ncbi:MAG: transcription termination factor Rho [Planctomycetaceae bacterium]|nr:transcription termination factor Rho [Planctomycetaceae bacterium]